MGVGLVDLVLVGAAATFLFRRNARRHPQPPAGAGVRPGTASQAIEVVPAPVRAPAGPGDLARAIVETRRSDRDFFAESVERAASECFRLVHTALVMRDAGHIRGRLTPEMYAILRGQVADLKTAGRFRHVERVEIDAARLTELWQAHGEDVATVHVVSRLIDYTADGAGTVVAGSPSTPVCVTQWWTFTRPIGPHAWTLAAIEQR
ncbi:MAG: TIM44-like domain-containing protein [Candidatus Rokuibacteriota bacterium]